MPCVRLFDLLTLDRRVQQAARSCPKLYSNRRLGRAWKGHVIYAFRRRGAKRLSRHRNPLKTRTSRSTAASISDDVRRHR